MKSTKPLGGLFFLLILLVILAFGFVLGGGTNFLGTQPRYAKLTPLPSGAQIGTKDITPGTDKSIHIDTLDYVTPSATPIPPTVPADTVAPKSGGTSCTKAFPFHDCGGHEKPYLVCTEGSCASGLKTPDGKSCDYLPGDDWIADKACDSNCHQECVEKPVIYLYPTTDTQVSVQITSAGDVVASDPHYPTRGWQNIHAHPDGSFQYNEQTYHELFYETSHGSILEPKGGVIVPVGKLNETLQTLTTKLGLNAFEQKEFMSYWTGRLASIQTPYIKIAIVPDEEKAQIDRYAVTPKPDTIIAFLLYFKPMREAFGVNTSILVLPDPPKRVGFTLVEWGGILAQESE